MKEFFKKLWRWLTSLARKVWDFLIGWIVRIPQDKLLHAFFGMLIAAVAFICFGVPGCIFASAFAGLFKEFFDKFTTNQWDWWDFGATCIGGALIQICVFFSPLV